MMKSLLLRRRVVLMILVAITLCLAIAGLRAVPATKRLVGSLDPAMGLESGLADNIALIQAKLPRQDEALSRPAPDRHARRLPDARLFSRTDLFTDPTPDRPALLSASL
jgi:hypothetical protein